MRATAVGYQSVDRYSVQGKEGRKEEEEESQRREGRCVEEEDDEGKEAGGGERGLICIVGTRHIQFSWKMAVRNTALGSKRATRDIGVAKSRFDPG